MEVVTYLSMNRKPPIGIRRLLRKEVNYGCPIENCGTPYLSFHHFDPIWKEKQHHNPEGMIALCPTHAALADGGAWTKNQIRDIKNNPFIKANQIADRFRFLRNDVVCQVGSLAYGFTEFMKISNEKVFGFERGQDSYIELSMLFRDRYGNILLEMIKNDWTVYTNEIFDFECPTQGRSFKIRAKDKLTDFSVRFDDYSINEFIEHYNVYDTKQLEFLLNHMGRPENIHVLKIVGRLQMGKHSIRLSENSIHAKSENVDFKLNAKILIGYEGLSLFSFNKDGTISLGTR